MRALGRFAACQRINVSVSKVSERESQGVQKTVV